MAVCPVANAVVKPVKRMSVWPSGMGIILTEDGCDVPNSVRFGAGVLSGSSWQMVSESKKDLLARWAAISVNAGIWL